MPVFVEWKWIEKTETFLAVFHFWDDGNKQNLRMRTEEWGFETCVYIGEEDAPKEGFVPIITLPGFIREYPKFDAYLSWAPSMLSFVS